MNRLDPEKKLIDFNILNGASVCRKGQEILSVMYPMLTCAVGAELTCHNIFKRLLKLGPIKSLIREDKTIYKVFGGIRHHPHVYFQAQMVLFEGQELKLLNPSPTRFAGYFLAMQRTLCCKDAL